MKETTDVVQAAIGFSPQPEGGYTVTSPVLPGLVTEGDTIQEALENARDAFAAIIEAFQQLGRPFPLLATSVR